MLGKILTDSLERLEHYQSTRPEEVLDIQFKLEAFKAHMKWVRSYWEEPTLEELEKTN